MYTFRPLVNFHKVEYRSRNLFMGWRRRETEYTQENYIDKREEQIRNERVYQRQGKYADNKEK